MARVEDIMTQAPICCTPDAELKAVARMMCDNDCGEIPVVENQENMKPIGVVTDRDITCRAVAQGKNPIELKARDCMSSPCVTVTPDLSLEDCCEVLEEHMIRRVPVVDREGRCIGIVAQADIARRAPANKTAEVLKEVSQALA